MKAVVQDRFGQPDMLELREVDEPPAGDSDVLVRVRAASVNPADLYAMTGTPWVARPETGLRRPRTTGVGLDMAGVVAAVGGNATRFKPGDEVFGAGTWTLAECAAVAEDALVAKPANVSFEQAAAVPVAGLTALQGLRDKKVVFFVSKALTEDLTALAELLEAGTVTPVVKRTWPLSEAADALRHLGEGHARGKLVVVV